MKNLALAAILISLSGTALMAQEDTTGLPELTAEQKAKLPSEAISLYGDLKSGNFKAETPTEITQYINNIDSKVKEASNTLTDFNKKYGYDQTVASLIQMADGNLDTIKTNEKSLDTAVQNIGKSGDAVQKTIGFINYLIENNLIPAPSDFPAKCQNYREYPAVGNRQLSGGVWKVTLCFDSTDKLVSCTKDHSIIKSTADYQFASSAGTTNGESISDRPPARGDGTVYMTAAPTPTNGKTVQVQCYNPAQ